MLEDGPSNSAGNVGSISFSRYPQIRSYYSQAMSCRPRANTRKLHEDKCGHCGKEKHPIENDQPKMLNVITTSEKVTIAHYASSRKILHHLKTTSKTILTVSRRNDL